ncbi:MAG: hypothetical protein ACE364_01320 [Chlorobiota bacterium]
MRIKKITAKNLAEGKQLVKDKLGEDAVILSTRTVKDEQNKTEKLEIVAAIDNKNKSNENYGSNQSEITGINKVDKHNSKLDLLLSQVAYPLLEFLDNNSQKVYKQLIDIGYDDIFALEVVKELSRNINSDLDIKEAINLIASKIKFSNLLEKKLSQQIFSFVGPAGSGKTSMILKYATIHKIMHSSKILIINTNNYNFGDKDILEIQCRSLGFDYNSISKLEDLSEIIKKSKGYDLVLIDTYSEFKITSNKAENILILPTVLDKEYINKCLSYYEHNFLCFSFTDKNLNIQNIIDLVLNTDAPLVFYSTGGDIPDDFEVFDKSTLMKFLVKDVK